MNAIEVRTISMDAEDSAEPILFVESRCGEGDSRSESQDWIVGYAARFGVNSLDLGDFIERIDPGAFGLVAERRGRKSPLETRALFNHDPNHLLGRYPDTLRMRVDEKGLRYEIRPPESRRDIVELIRRGDIRGSSFSFVVGAGDEEWSVEEGRSVRTIKRIKALYDVGPVTYPAYPETHVAVAQRSYQNWLESSRGSGSVRSAAAAARRATIEKTREFLKQRGY